jgi:hypothetical protein
MIRKLLLAAAIAAATLAVAGCGGGSDNKALSYSDFSKKVNDVCLSANKNVKPISDKLTGKAATDAPVYDELIPKLQDARNSLNDLTPPDQLKSAYDTFKSLTDQQIQGAKDAQTKAKAGDDAAYIQQIKSLQPLGQQSNEAGSKLGAAACAK